MTPPQQMESPGSMPQTADGSAQPLDTVDAQPDQQPSPPWIALQTSVQSLSDMFESRLRQDKTKDEAFNRLYAELDTLRRAESVQQLKPFYLDLILLYDRIEQICSAQTEPAIADLLGTIRDELLEVLYRRDVAPIYQASMNFDSSVQQAIGTELAASPDDNNVVARVIRRGFRCGERVLRPEEVIVKRYRQEAKT
jgi:molecular chaperone GrpE (heat shock protein)